MKLTKLARAKGYAISRLVGSCGPEKTGAALHP